MYAHNKSLVEKNKENFQIKNDVRKMEHAYQLRS